MQVDTEKQPELGEAIMSWLYSIVFAGLVFSSQEKSVLLTVPEVDKLSAVEQVQAGDETEKFERSYPLNANGRVSISNVNGSIVMEAWDRNEVKLEYTKVADSRERLADVEIQIESRPDFLSVQTDYGRGDGGGQRWKNGGKLSVEFRLMVPKGAVLNEVETVNGSVTVSDFVNQTAISAVNGSVNATNIRGTAKLSTVNGEVKADFDRLETGSKISLETVNGTVKLTLPSDANATVRAESLNGNITNDFGLTVRKGKYVGRDLHGKLGNGDVQIRLESVNGGLSIGRKNDGKSISPAINLLQKNSNDDWESELDASVSMNSAKMNKQIEKAVKDSSKVAATVSTKVAAAAMADAQHEIERLKPEMDKLNAEAMANVSESLTKTAELLNSEKMGSRIRDIQRESAAFARLADANFFPAIPRVEKKSASFAVKGIPKVTILGKGCSVTVRGWDKQEVQYSVTQIGEQRNRQQINLKEEHTESTVNVTVEAPSDGAPDARYLDESRRLRIEVFVPRKTNLKIDANGTIRLDGVSGELQIAGDDEKIDIRDSDGKLNVTNSDGQVRIIGFTGDLTAKTGDGEVRMDGNFSSIAGWANDGAFVLTVPDSIDADILGSGKTGFSFRLEDIETGKKISESNWKFGAGSRKYKFTSNDGSLIVQNRSLVEVGAQ